MKNLKTYILAAVVAVVATLLTQQFIASPTAFTTQPEAKESAHDRVMRTNTLRCGYAETGTYLYTNFQENELDGFIVDIIEAMAKKMGVSVDWTAEVGYADFAEGLKTGRYDAFCGAMTMTAERSRQATYTIPYIHGVYYIYKRADDNKKYQSLEDINKPDITYAAIDGEVFQRFSQELLPDAKAYTLPNMTNGSQLFVDLSYGKADVLIQDGTTKLDFDKSHPGKIVRALPEPVKYANTGFAVAQNEFELVETMNVALRNMIVSGEIDKILNDHGLTDEIIFRAATPYRKPE